jgi:hypothetical protein
MHIMDPQPTQVAAQSAELKLNCVVCGRDASSGFVVKIARNDLISELKEKIVEHPFARVNARDFKLFRVSLAFDENLMQN